MNMRAADASVSITPKAMKALPMVEVCAQVVGLSKRISARLLAIEGGSFGSGCGDVGRGLVEVVQFIGVDDLDRRVLRSGRCRLGSRLGRWPGHLTSSELICARASATSDGNVLGLASTLA